MNTGHWTILVYVIPFAIGLVIAWKRNIALYIALSGLTLLGSFLLVALYVTMLIGYLLPWAVLGVALYISKRRSKELV